VDRLDADVHADVAIVGGGIAGITTAFFTLRNTEHSVVLLEADKIAHGATGHNAGQLTSYFERPLYDLVAEFGLQRAIEAQRNVESGWTLLDQILAETQLQTPVYRFTGYAGLSTLEQLVEHLKNNRCRLEGGLNARVIMVAEEWEGRNHIPVEYLDLITVTPHSDVLSLLETSNQGFIACISAEKGCMNSALFSEELAGYLLSTYKDRFSLYEESPVQSVNLTQTNAELRVAAHAVTATKVVLCTNGFENFTIENKEGPAIDTKFHHAIAGRIGYMSGYLEPLNHPPTAISYYSEPKEKTNDPAGEQYFYLTRRPYEHDAKDPHNLICAGGPEKVLPNGAEYSREDYCQEDMRSRIDEFLRDNYGKHPSNETAYAFCWHGLMGYTPNRVRRIGPEPCNPTLLYNIGCNGVGILPSIFGGLRISHFVRGDSVEPSIFDPDDQRCELPQS
jgi:glycine/D-amino acid oxidase-like deaminating enzyme